MRQQAEIYSITQWESEPESWPAVEGVTGDILAICWKRVEHFIARRFVPRQVVWTMTTSGGDWQPPLGRIYEADAFVWANGDWESATIKRAPGGYVLPCGNVQINCTVGQPGASIPASVKEAVKRLAAYLTAEPVMPAGARSYSANVGQLSESISADPAGQAKALQNSGAADLLRSYRRPDNGPVAEDI